MGSMRPARMSLRLPTGSRRGVGAPVDWRRWRRGWQRTLLLSGLVGVATGLVVAGFEGLAGRVLLPRVGRAPLGVEAMAPSRTHVVVRVAVAGAALAGLAGLSRAVYDTPLSLGPGYEAVRWATAPGRAAGLVVLLLMIRAAATALTVSGGGAGGLFIPSWWRGRCSVVS